MPIVGRCYSSQMTVRVTFTPGPVSPGISRACPIPVSSSYACPHMSMTCLSHMDRQVPIVGGEGQQHPLQAAARRVWWGLWWMHFLATQAGRPGAARGAFHPPGTWVRHSLGASASAAPAPGPGDIFYCMLFWWLGRPPSLRLPEPPAQQGTGRDGLQVAGSATCPGSRSSSGLDPHSFCRAERPAGSGGRPSHW